MKILIVNNHLLFLEALQNLLVTNEISVAGVALCGKEAVAIATDLRPDVILMDVQLPDCNGIEAIRLIKEQVPETKIVMLTLWADDEALFQAVKNGASSYLLKSSGTTDFFELLEGLERGEAPMNRSLATNLLNEFAHCAHDSMTVGEGVDGITVQQTAVLNYLAQGWTNKQIADTLFISECIVNYHVQDILHRLHLRNRTRAKPMQYALT